MKKFIAFLAKLLLVSVTALYIPLIIQIYNVFTSTDPNQSKIDYLVILQFPMLTTMLLFMSLVLREFIEDDEEQPKPKAPWQK